MNSVVITGLGIYSCIGKNLEEVRNSLYQGKSGIVFEPERKEFGYRSGLTGYVERPNLKGLLDRRARITLPEQGEYAYLATREALQQAGIDQDYLDAHEVGILYGNDSSAKPVIDAIDIIREKKDTTLVGSGSVFQTMNSTVTINLATIFKLKGYKFYHQCGLRQRITCHWPRLSFHKKRSAGLHYLRRRPGNEYLFHGQF